MKKQILFRLSLICAWLLMGFGLVQAQWSSRGLANGITVATTTEITPKNSPNSQFKISDYDFPLNNSDVICRVIKNEKDKTYFGYELEVKASAEKGKYTVFINPLSAESKRSLKIVEGYTIQTLTKSPLEIEVSEGDLITVAVMENPVTKEKVVDYIKVFYKPAPQTDFFAERKSIRDFTLDDVELQLNKFEFFADNQSILKVSGGAAGSNIFVYVKGRGRFVFSLFPHNGYKFQKIGVIEGSKILFKYGGVDYKIISGTAIVGTGGHWNLWVLYQPDYKPSDPNEPHEYGGSDRGDFEIPKK